MGGTEDVAELVEILARATGAVFGDAPLKRGHQARLLAVLEGVAGLAGQRGTLSVAEGQARTQALRLDLEVVLAEIRRG